MDVICDNAIGFFKSTESGMGRIQRSFSHYILRSLLVLMAMRKEETMTLHESSGEGKWMKPTETFQALLCDPLGNFVIGSIEDKRLLNEAFQEIKDIEKYGRHIHKAMISRNDICALCGHDLRHSIHLRYGE